MSISIDNSLLTYTAENAKSSSKTAALEAKLNTVSDETTDEEMMEACKTFESYMVEQMIKALEKTIPKNEDEKENDYVSSFKDNLFQEYAQQITDSGELGIAQQLYESMKLNTKGLL